MREFVLLSLFVSTILGYQDIKIVERNDGLVQKCSYDEIRVSIEWKEHGNETAENMFGVGLFIDDSAIVTPSIVFRMPFDDKKDKPTSSFVLKCDLDPEFCQLKIESIQMDPEMLQFKNEVVIIFNQDTNTPIVASKSQLESILQFSDEFSMPMTGVWIDKRTLRIRIPDQSQLIPLKVESIALRVVEQSNHRTVSHILIPKQHEIAVRIGQTGQYKFGIIDHKDVQPFAFEIIPCTSMVLHSIHIPQVKVPLQSTFQSKGVIAMSESQAIELPHSLLPNQLDGTWSLSMDVFLTAESSGDFRTLFYKGPGHEQRTPSAWIEQQSRRLTMRVSTVTQPDFGASTIQEIPLHEWTSLAFVFTNSSTGSNELRQTHYQIAMYMNGKLDSVMKVAEPVLPNTGPLQIGKDPWMKSFDGYISNIRTFGWALSAEEIQADFSYHDTHDPLFELVASVYRPQDTALLPRPIETPPVNLINQGELESDANFERKFELVDAASESGNSNAMYEAGMMRLSLEGERINQKVYRNATLAREYLQRSAALGHTEAIHMLAVMYATGMGKIPAENAVCLASENSMGTSDANIAVALYHLAAAKGSYKSALVLGQRYLDGRDVVQDLETSAYYFSVAADEASKFYNSAGNQPRHEMNKLSTATEDTVHVGQRGQEDELIQYQQLRADQGHVPSIVAMGDLYYWGARGVERDHVRAYEYFRRAADAGDIDGQVALAGMLLKGEGTEQDTATAVALYEAAAEKGNIKALNGLGYAYFFGKTVEKDEKKALEYFERGAILEVHGDSLYNAGYMYYNGIGTSVNKTKAAEYYEKAALKFGQFNAVYELGKMHLYGNGVERSARKAIDYLRPAARAGEWGGRVRQGFNHFLAGDHDGSVILYHEASEYGYEVAHSNIAYLYNKELADATAISSGAESNREKAFQQFLIAARHGDVDSYVPIGDYYYYGYGAVEQDAQQAVSWYSRASASGIAQGAFNVAYMYEHGLGVSKQSYRAERYYQRALNLTDSVEQRIGIHFALYRLQLKRWLNYI